MEINIDEEFKNDNNINIKDEANVIPVNTDENIPVDNSSDNKIEIIETDNKNNNNINDEKINLNSHQHHHHNNNNNNFSLKLNNHLNNHHHHNCKNPNCPLNKKQSNFEQLKQHLFFTCEINFILGVYFKYEIFIRSNSNRKFLFKIINFFIIFISINFNNIFLFTLQFHSEKNIIHRIRRRNRKICHKIQSRNSKKQMRNL